MWYWFTADWAGVPSRSLNGAEDKVNLRRKDGQGRLPWPGQDQRVIMRNFLHYLISILLWILFGYYWYVVVQRQISRESLEPLVILTGITVLGLVITLWWIAHNKRIAANGP